MNNYLLTSAEFLGWKLEISTRAKTSNNIKMPGWHGAEGTCSLPSELLYPSIRAPQWGRTRKHMWAVPLSP